MVFTAIVSCPTAVIFIQAHHISRFNDSTMAPILRMPLLNQRTYHKKMDFRGILLVSQEMALVQDGEHVAEVSLGLLIGGLSRPNRRRQLAIESLFDIHDLLRPVVSMLTGLPN